MVSGSLLGLSLPLLLFLLAPGYLGLRGYLKASVQLDSISRTDKLIIGLIGGIISLGVMLVLNRFGLLGTIVEVWYSLWTNQTPSLNLGFDRKHAVTLKIARSLTGLSLMGFFVGQSAVAYVGGYLYGIHRHVASDEMPKAKEDLEQPWERAVKDSVITGEITVITKQGDEIKGNLYRIGSPSENYDVLLSGAEKIIQGGDNEGLGVTYHHHQDISRVEFDVPGIDPNDEFNNEYDRWLAQQYSRLRAGAQKFRSSPREQTREWYRRASARILSVGRDVVIQIKQSREPSADSRQVQEKLKEASHRASRLYSELQNKK